MLQLIRADDLVASAKGIEWQVDDLLPADSIGIWFGESGSYKSFAALELALCTVTGRDFFGMPVRQGAAYWIAGEGRGGFARRIVASNRHHDTNIDGLPFYITGSSVPLIDELALAELSELIRSTASGAAALIVIDTMAANFGAGDENFTRDATAFIGAMNALREISGATVIAIHHSGHGDRTRSRGAYALTAGVDFEFRIDRCEQGIVQLVCTKQKDTEIPEPLTMQTVPVEWTDPEFGDLSSLVLEHLPDYERPSNSEAGLGDVQARMLDLLRQMYKEARENLETDGRDPNSARVEVNWWRDRAMREGILKEKDRQGFYKRKGSLQKRGAISIDGTHVFLRD